MVDLASLNGSAPAVLEELTRAHPEVRVLLLSNGEDDEAAESCFKAGASGLLDKNNVEVNQVVHALRAVLRGLRVFPASLLSSAFSEPAPREGQPEPLRIPLRPGSGRCSRTSPAAPTTSRSPAACRSPSAR